MCILILCEECTTTKINVIALYIHIYHINDGSCVCRRMCVCNFIQFPGGNWHMPVKIICVYKYNA